MDRRAYFDGISSRWDTFTDAGRVQSALREVVTAYGIQPDEHVVDLGCGTGNLSHVLCSLLGDRGRITAVDISPAMIDVARGRLADPRVTWVVADAIALPLAEESVDRVICFSAWPHFPDPGTVATELGRVLRPGGALHIVHIDGREKINGIHTGVGGAIADDILPSATALAVVLRGAGFEPFEELDAPDTYRVSARWNR